MGNRGANEEDFRHSPGNKSRIPGNPNPPDVAVDVGAPCSELVSASGGGSRVETALMVDAGVDVAARWFVGVVGVAGRVLRRPDVVVVGEVVGDADAGGGSAVVAVVIVVVGTAAIVDVVVAGLDVADRDAI